MKRIYLRLAALGLVVAAFAAGGLLAARNVSAVPPPTAVTVVNGTSSPVPTAVVGTPTVNVGGTVAVQQAREPFQQFVTAFSEVGENCDPITVPAGKHLVLESFSVDADSSNSDPPFVYLLVKTGVGGGGTAFVRPVSADLQKSVSGWSAVMNVLLHTGSPAPGGPTFNIEACVHHAVGAANGSIRGFVSGWLENN